MSASPSSQTEAVLLLRYKSVFSFDRFDVASHTQTSLRPRGRADLFCRVASAVAGDVSCSISLETWGLILLPENGSPVSGVLLSVSGLGSLLWRRPMFVKWQRDETFIISSPPDYNFASVGRVLFLSISVSFALITHPLLFKPDFLFTLALKPICPRRVQVYPLLHGCPMWHEDVTKRTKMPLRSVCRRGQPFVWYYVGVMEPDSLLPNCWVRGTEGPGSGHRRLEAGSTADIWSPWRYCATFRAGTLSLILLMLDVTILRNFQGLQLVSFPVLKARFCNPIRFSPGKNFWIVKQLLFVS